MNIPGSSEKVGAQAAAEQTRGLKDDWSEDSDAPHLPPEPRHIDLDVRLIANPGD